MTGEVFIVTRVITLADPVADELGATLATCPGVTEIRRDGARRLAVTYDVSRIGLDGIESALARAGATLAGGVVHRLGRAWARFTETNTRANARIVRHCCNNLPEDR